MSGTARWALVALMGLLGAMILMGPAAAQVDCRNGKYCPAGNICLKDNQCGQAVEAPPGSFRTASGTWCEPGFREHAHRPGSCVPRGYTDCTNGAICPPGTACTNTGSCTGGPRPTGPMCGGGQCHEGRVCSSAGRCMNTTYYQDCGGGVICSKNKACALNGGCAIVGIARTQQIPYDRGGKRNQNSLQ